MGEAAVLGQTFRLEDLHAISALSEWEVLEHLDVAMERQLVHEVPSETMLRFRHAEIQQVLYADLGLLRRRLLHRTVAEWFEEKYLISEDEQSQEDVANHAAVYSLLAYHYHHAEDLRQERRYAQLAGKQASAQFANAEALTYFDRVLTLTPEADILHQYEVRLMREKIYDRQGARAEQEQDLHRLAEIVAQLADGTHEAIERQAVVALRQTNYAYATSNYAEATRQARIAIKLAQQCQNIRLEAMGYLRHGAVLIHMGNYDEARPEFEKALSLAEMADLPQIKARSLRNLGIVTWQQGDHEASTSYEQQALALYQAIGDLHGEGKALGNLGVSFCDAGDYTQAVHYYSRALVIYQQIGDLHGESIILNNLGMVAARQGSYALGVVYVEQALAICQEIDDKLSEASLISNLGLLHYHLQKNEAAVDYCKQAIALAQKLGNDRILGFALTNLGYALLGLDKFEAATVAFQRSLTLRQELGEPHLAMESHTGLAAVALAQQRLRDALNHVEPIIDFLKVNMLFGASNPFQIYWTCYQVLSAIGDSRASYLLQIAYERLDSLTVQIDNPDIRHSFLTNVVAHQAIISEWEKQNSL